MGEGPAAVRDAEKGSEIAIRKVEERGVRCEFPYYWDAFERLSTERQFGMAVGPIPDSMAYAYARHDRLTPLETEIFVDVIRAIDNHYLGRLAERRDQETRKHR